MVVVLYYIIVKWKWIGNNISFSQHKRLRKKIYSETKSILFLIEQYKKLQNVKWYDLNQ
jgi:hypothetical protein